MRVRNLYPVLLLAILVLSGCAVSAPVASSQAGSPSAVSETPTEYAVPGALVDTEWVVEHLDDPNVRLLHVTTDAEAYQAGHIPGAVFVHGFQELTNPEDSTRGQILTQEAFSALLSEKGVEQDDTIVVYDDIRNLWATRAYWVMAYYQHPDVRLYNGGLTQWQEAGQALSSEEVALTPTKYAANGADPEIRTTTEYLLEHLDDPNTLTCDTRSPDEYAGTDVRSGRGGHIPGAINLEWTHAVNDDGTFKSAEELYDLFTRAGFAQDKKIITYCQTGVRGAHSWFVLRELLGFPDVRNYDGSWEEYGNRTDTPIG